MAATTQKPLLWLLIGGGIAVAIGVGLAIIMSSGHKSDPPMQTAPTGLTFNVSDAPRLNSKKPLRCFVNGALVGELTLADCAKKNGVATQALDVGLDDSGNMTAAPTGSLAPVPVAPSSALAGKPATSAAPDTDATPAPTAEVVPATAAVAGPTASCLRYNSNQWNKLSDSLTIGQCVQLLYDGRCVSPGTAAYGRWGDKTLRLVPKRVEQSDDNATFRPLVEQGQGCSVPMVH